MKMITAIVNKKDTNDVCLALMENRFEFTKLATTGGFLKSGNTTLMIGVDDEKLETALDLIRKNCAKRMGVSARSVGVSSAKGRWGSCSANGGIRYTFRLVYAPVEVIEYVVVHELCHLKVRNHSKAFWREVENALPDYQKKRAWLKAHAYLTEIF